MNYVLSEAEEPIRQALERLVESPRELRCYLTVEDVVIGRFVQFCTVPQPSRFRGSSRLQGPEPLIFDGTGVKDKSGYYEGIHEFCDVERATELALETLARHLPEDAEIRIIEESSELERPS